MVNSKRVFCVRPHVPQRFLELLGQRADITVDLLDHDSDEKTVEPVLSTAHAYQSSSTRQELVTRFHTTPELLARAPNLLMVSAAGAGYDTIDVPACTKAGVLVVNQSGGNAESVAEHALAMIISLSKLIIQTDRALRRGTLKDRNVFMGTEVLGKTVGIVGLGNVGRRLAELCRGLLRMQVLACDPYLSAAQIEARGATKVALEDLLRRSDYVSINCPLTPESRGMIGAQQFALMQPHAYFITTARGFIHDEKALEAALRNSAIAGAGLDVWEEEPPPASHPLMQCDNVLISPHTAGVTTEARIRMGQFAAEQMIDTLDGKRPPRLINPEAWPLYAQRFERIFGVAPASQPAQQD
jgi:D-3-phosphoglycerate dehydrogenase / 2-oxoglutarate reductase